MSKIQIWILQVKGSAGNEKVNFYHRLPVNPEKIIVNDAEGDKTLNTYTISSVYPKEYNPSYCDARPQYSPDKFISFVNRWQGLTKKANKLDSLKDEISPEDYAKLKDVINKKKNENGGLRLVITGENIIARVEVADFSYEINGFDVKYTLTLKDTILQSRYEHLVRTSNAVSNIKLKDAPDSYLTYTPRTEKESMYSLLSFLSNGLEKRIMDILIEYNPELSRYKQAHELILKEYEGNEFNLDTEVDTMQSFQLKNLHGFLNLYPKYGDFDNIIRAKSNKGIYDHFGLPGPGKATSILNDGIKDIYHTPFSVIYNDKPENIKIFVPTLEDARKLVSNEPLTEEEEGETNETK